VRYPLIMGWTIGCAAGPDLSTAERVDELLVASGVRSMATASGHRVVWQADSVLWLQELGREPAALDEADLDVVGAAAWGDEAMLLATAAGLTMVDGFLRSSSVDEALDGELRQMNARGDAVWLRTDRSLYLWRGGVLSRFAADDDASGPFAVGGLVDGQPALWATHGRLRAWVETDAGWSVVADPGARGVRAAASDIDGRAYFVADGALSAWGQSGWQVLTYGVDDVAAHPAAAGAWARRGDQLLRINAGPDGLALTDHGDLPGAGALAVDDVGRALVIADGALVRVSAEPTLAVDALPDGAAWTEPADVVAVPSPPEAFGTVDLLIDGVATPMDGPDALGTFRAVANPALVEPGLHEITVRAVSVDDLTLQSAPRRWSAADDGPITWVEHVQPLYVERCSFCHDNGTETVLQSREDWVASIDAIEAELIAARMPVGGVPFTAAEVGLVQRWASGGFLP
jgi:hypothetical protein